MYFNYKIGEVIIVVFKLLFKSILQNFKYFSFYGTLVLAANDWYLVSAEDGYTMLILWPVSLHTWVSSVV